jgi:hypothetical protein
VFFGNLEKSQFFLTRIDLIHSKNWSVVSTLITAQKQCLSKCRFKCGNDTFKCENDTPFILSSVGNDSLSVFLILLSVILFRHLKVSFPTLDKIKGVSFSHLKVLFSHL